MKRTIKYSIKSAKDIYKTFYPEPAFLVPGLIPLKGLSIIAGPPKGGKSWFALSLCLMLSRTGTFLGSLILEMHKGLYLALEDSESRIHFRLNFLGVEPSDIFLVTTSFPSGLDGINALEKLLAEDRTIEYVVIDTFGKFSNGISLGKYNDDYSWLGLIKSIADEYEISIILVTHLRKMKDDHDPFNEINGSTGTLGVPDSLLILKKMRNTGNGTLFCSGRDIEEKTYEVFFSKDTCCWSIKGECSELASTPERQSILEIMKGHGEMTPQEISKLIDRTPKAVSNILAKLREEGLVEKGSKYGTWVSSKSSVSTTSSISSGTDTELCELSSEQLGALI